MRGSILSFALLVAPLLNACRPIPIIRVPGVTEPRARDDYTEHAFVTLAGATPSEAGGAPARNVVVLFDGTDSGPRERSNVYKLNEMIIAEGRPDVLSFYIEGVGVGFKPIGSATAWGIDYRLVLAYAFLLEHRRAGDRIHLFGFSRGAFAARIVAAMLYFAGLPEDPASVCAASHADAGTRAGLLQRSDCLRGVSERVYRAYKGKRSPEERIERIRRALDGLGLRFSRPVKVATLGLWDTIEAFGLVDTWEAFQVELGVKVPRDPGERNRRYGDQLCNVDRALQALSIDDNRANLYTPKLLTLPHLFRNCEPRDRSRDSEDFSMVEEVWFSGAHADVGGGYVDCEYGSGCMSNISFNWMVQRLLRERTGVLREHIVLDADELSEAHDGESHSRLYKRVQRDVRELVGRSRYNGGRPRIHCSVIERLARRKPRCHEYGWGFPREGCSGGDVIDAGSGGGGSRGLHADACFQESAGGYEYAGSRIPAKACIDEALDPEVSGCWFTVVR